MKPRAADFNRHVSMKTVHCINEKGEEFILFQNSKGYYCCPVCGSPAFQEAPYHENGAASFQMCSCGFEFGYDDSPLATKEAVEGIKSNWDRWRLRLIEQSSQSKPDLVNLEKHLSNLGISLAFDLLPIKKHQNT